MQQLPTYGQHLTGILTALLLCACLPAAGQGNADDDDRPVAVCSTTQVADFTRQVVGDRWKVISVLSPKQDPHMFQPTPRVTQQVSAADICFDNGLHLEGNDWMRTVAEQSGKTIISCTEGIKPLQLQMERETESVPDPHAWFSPANAAVYVRNILQAVVVLDPAHEAEYNARATLYLDQLRTLDLWIQRQLNAIPNHQRLMVTSHDAFNYYCQAYGLESAAPVGWSTQEVGAEVTPQRRSEVIAAIRRSGVPAIFVETSVNPELIREIAQEAKVRIGGKLYSDAMGAAGSAGETYLGMMRENTLAIVQGLANDGTEGRE